MTATSGTAGGPQAHAGDRGHLANLHSLFVLSTIMNDEPDENAVLERALASVAALGPCRAEAAFLMDGRLPVRTPGTPRPTAPGLDGQVRRLRGREGPISVPGSDWGWAFVLGTGDGTVGYLVCSAPVPPGDDDRYVLRILAQQTAAALANVAARRRAHGHAVELARLGERRAAANARLAASVADLEHERAVHEALGAATANGAAVAGIAEAVHRLTGRAVAVEDRFGNLRAWAGPGRPEPYPKPEPAQHEEFLQAVARELRPVRDGGRLVALARHRGEVLGAVALTDAGARAGAREEFTLDRACAALALELAHQRDLAEVELRLRRNLVDDLIDGTDADSAYARAAAIGHDLHGPHHLAAVRWSGRGADEGFLQAVGRAAAGLRMRPLLAGRADTAVLVLRGGPPGRALHEAVARELGSTAGAVGVGGRCDTPAEIPRSFQEALRALEVRRSSRSPDGTTAFDELGLYRILGPGAGDHEVDRFVREWLGPLLDYDGAHHSELVQTLFQYFECGGGYDATAAALAIHRSTLRYRLQRIREISGSDLGDVDSRLNLHVATRVWKVLDGPA
ncbi:hypothetical protein GCM10018793_46390 [Streptomyces sulfonofaciens]|uniref:Transcriptional regulator n=1 Tax=Streptomyces sulfonofaciens TaxID=68272 RepID=A0A919GGL0_9ACTN|nr:helix-turn-helix domain-containing protein [Streptomyces sulfonofaciens]GHH83688.1 hypothetical protein GCM10018793_46390 [Streptomyces sulfonofaciens]